MSGLGFEAECEYVRWYEKLFSYSVTVNVRGAEGNTAK